MRAGHGAEDQDQNDEHRAGRKRVAEQGEGDIAAREVRPHDARTDDCREQKAGPEAFRKQPTRQRLGGAHAFWDARVAPSICPISRSRFVRAILSRLASGNAIKHVMRLRM